MVSSGNPRKIASDKLNDFVLDTATANELAKSYKFDRSGGPEKDPFPNIDASLLSADEIIQYVNKTGMIAPFSAQNHENEKSRLKSASYEGRIGKCAYIFEKGKNAPTQVFHEGDDHLKVPANTIVFVECDLDFRLPPFIAVRFNLQINHVHRGLLLGTGPLVDPCFWGKLCIPLHNLTSSDYVIPATEGIIWVEFTRTTSLPKSGRPPSNTGFWDIKQFITKASEEYDTRTSPVSIRSSIPDMTEESRQLAETAKLDSKASRNSAEKAKEFAEKVKNWGTAAAVGTIIGVMGLWASFYFSTRALIEDNLKEINQIRADLVNTQNLNDELLEETKTLKDKLKTIENSNTNQENPK